MRQVLVENVLVSCGKPENESVLARSLDHVIDQLSFPTKTRSTLRPRKRRCSLTRSRRSRSSRFVDREERLPGKGQTSFAFLNRFGQQIVDNSAPGHLSSFCVEAHTRWREPSQNCRLRTRKAAVVRFLLSLHCQSPTILHPSTDITSN